MVVDGADEIATPLSVLSNRCLETSDFPSEEKIAKIAPIYRSDDTPSMENYRRISVLPVLSKVLERVDHQHLYDYLEKISYFLDDNLVSEKGRLRSMQ